MSSSTCWSTPRPEHVGRNGGQTEHLRHLLNHQSCEGKGHDARARVIHEQGPEAYHDSVCAEIDLPPSDTAVMGTAANMCYAAVAHEGDESVQVAAIVTAGVQTNATCAGRSGRMARDR